MISSYKVFEIIKAYPKWIRVLLVFCVLIPFVVKVFVHEESIVKDLIFILCALIIVFVIIFVPRLKIGTLDITVLKIAFVRLEKDIFQTGIMFNVVNLTNKPVLLKKICFYGDEIKMLSKASSSIPIPKEGEPTPFQILGKRLDTEILGNNYLETNKSMQYKVLLPFKQTVFTGDIAPWEWIFMGSWRLTDENNQDYNVLPRTYGNSSKIFEMEDWNRLSDFEVEYKTLPVIDSEEEGSECYILYSLDKFFSKSCFNLFSILNLLILFLVISCKFVEG